MPVTIDTAFELAWAARGTLYCPAYWGRAILEWLKVSQLYWISFAPMVGWCMDHAKLTPSEKGWLAGKVLPYYDPPHHDVLWETNAAMTRCTIYCFRERETFLAAIRSEVEVHLIPDLADMVMQY